MTSSRFSFSTLTAALLLLLVTAVGSQPSPPKPTCDINTYTTRWFLEHARADYRRGISNALFYTRNASDFARALARGSNGEYVTIWDIWDEWLYDMKDCDLACIHSDEKISRRFFENMSRAFARMARKGADGRPYDATVMHLSKDYDAPPLDGIWGQVELPHLRNSTDIEKMKKIKEHNTDPTFYNVMYKTARDVFMVAMSQANEWLGQAEYAPKKDLKARRPLWGSDQKVASCNLPSGRPHPLNELM